MTRRVAFFDLDGTLLAKNSGRLWLQRERRLGRLSRWQLLQGTFYLAAYKFQALDMEHVMTKALATVKGELEETVRRWTHEWFFDEVVPCEAPGAREVLERHRQRGDLLVLLTSSSPYESEVAAKHFGLDAFLCSHYEVRGGRFTGQLEGPPCYGAGKVHHAEAFAREHGLDLTHAAFYSDSFSDLPMMHRVGHPFAVDPDLRLRLTARRHGWPVVSWR